MKFDWYVIVQGGLFDRVTLHGPFKGQDKANAEVKLMQEYIGDTLTVHPLWPTDNSTKVRKRK
ncbi:MAG: hypothetical protein IH991_12805 [Planctomycetes bacterium]|nr:hypothetical protein [Planctomycetota bacterium]